jgi:hypothetical protein
VEVRPYQRKVRAWRWGGWAQLIERAFYAGNLRDRLDTLFILSLMQMKFHQVPIGAKFTFLGESYTKLALSMAEDENRNGCIFHYEYEVESEVMDPDPKAGFPDYRHKSKLL